MFDIRDRSDHTIRELPDLLAAGDLVVVNTTQVRAARLHGHKDTGGKVEALLLNASPAGWEVLIRPARRIHKGQILHFGDIAARVVSEPVSGRTQLSFPGDVDVEDLAATIGAVPLPPYIRGSVDPARYQTVFADRVGSAAAPTAGLHLTHRVLAALKDREIGVAAVDLEVGIGTFRPMTAERLADHRMHAERYTIPPETAAAIGIANRVVAIGTTVVRTLESAAVEAGEVDAGSGTTDLFITPGFDFRIVDLLMTNFHVPGSSLVVMLAAFVGDAWRSVYEQALERRYRFLSFGDAMLCERAT